MLFADKLVVVTPVNLFDAARISHEMFHQNARGLHRQFNIGVNDARLIVQTCPQCSYHNSGLGLGTNPRGLKALEVWQTDVTHIAEFWLIAMCSCCYRHLLWIYMGFSLSG